jgi:hypothetical protein
MAWITPVTDRTDGSAMMTATDMDRITGNIAYLFDYATQEGHAPSGSTVTKTSWTKNDIIERDFWEDMLETLANICAAVEYVPDTDPTNAMEFENINNVEQISFNLYNIIANIGRMSAINHWAGDDLFAGDPVNAGGTYNG